MRKKPDDMSESVWWVLTTANNDQIQSLIDAPGKFRSEIIDLMTALETVLKNTWHPGYCRFHKEGKCDCWRVLPQEGLDYYREKYGDHGS